MLNKEPQFGPIGKEVFERTYARTKQDGKLESWGEMCKRVIDGNLSLVDEKYHEKDERKKLYELLFNMDIMPAGRHLWLSGVAGRAYLSNCHSAGFFEDDLAEHFTFTFQALMQGGGTGANYSQRYIDIYPPVVSPVELHIVCDPTHRDYATFNTILSKKYSANSPERITIEDSREGWSSALKKLLLSVWSGKSQAVILDVSGLRPKGAPLRSFGGESSGPEPLVVMLRNISAIINSSIGKKLTSLQMMGIDHEISKAVVAGSKRRSARMSIKSWKDSDIFEFVNCKKDSEKHWSTNISVEVDDDFFQALRKGDKRAKRVMKMIAIGAHRNGEPGVWQRTLSQVGEVDPVYTTNPCLRGDTLIPTTDGLTTIESWAKSGSIKQVWDGNKWVNAKAIYTGEREIIQLTFSNGAEIGCTPDHKFMTQDGQVVEAKDSLSRAISYERPKQDIHSPTDPLITCLGFIQGDGSYHTASNRWKYVYFGQDDGDVIKYFNKYAPEIIDGGDPNKSSQWIIPKDIGNALDILDPKPLPERVLSEFIMNFNIDQMRSFLVGLYSANGSVLEKARRVALKSACRKLIQQVQSALTLFGIRSYITVNKPNKVKFPNGTYTCKESYDLNITSSDIKTFSSTIGFIQSYKNERLTRVCAVLKEGRRLPIKVISINPLGSSKVYDYQMEETHWACVNGFRVANCGEISMPMADVCNLGHINLANFIDKDTEVKEAFRLVSRFLIRATFGDITNPKQQKVIARNRRIGVGFFGYHNWLAYQGIRFSESHHNKSIKDKLSAFKKVCRTEAEKYCFQLRIPTSIKVTTIAPTGTISNLAGSVSGCQPVFAKYYKRRVRYNTNDRNLKDLEAKGFHIEDSVYEANTKIVSFYCVDPIVAECEKRGINPDIVEEQSDISLSDHMAVQAMLQDVFADNSISYTLSFDPKKVKSIDIARMLKIHLPHLKGTTLMPEGDSRPQMPFERITREQFEEAQSKGLAMVSDAERECASGACPIK